MILYWIFFSSEDPCLRLHTVGTHFEEEQLIFLVPVTWKKKSWDTVLKVNRKLNSIKAPVERYSKVSQRKITTDQRQVSVKQI